MEDLESDDETSTQAAQSFDLLIELDEQDTQGEVVADCGCKLERTEYTVGFIFCDAHRKPLPPYLETETRFPSED